LNGTGICIYQEPALRFFVANKRRILLRFVLWLCDRAQFRYGTSRKLNTVDVTAETLYEAIAAALAALQKDNWVGEIGQGLATVTVLVQQPPIKHEVKIKDFLSWLGRQGRSPAEVMLKQKLEKILGKTTRGDDRKVKHTNLESEIS
jgi:hypothetical protein